MRQFPSGPDREIVSVGGGMQHDGTDLYYLSRDRKIMAVPIAIGEKALVPGTPRPLLDVDVVAPNDYAVSTH